MQYYAQKIFFLFKSQKAVNWLLQPAAAALVGACAAGCKLVIFYRLKMQYYSQ